MQVTSTGWSIGSMRSARCSGRANFGAWPSPLETVQIAHTSEEFGGAKAMTDGRCVVITGSASGIGLATRQRAERRGDIVIGVDRADADVEVDLADAKQRRDAVDSIIARADRSIDAVVACAGIGRAEPDTISVNYFGAVEILEGLRPVLAQATEPRAVVVVSMAIVHDVDGAIVD